jgi:Putative endonuclease, protein of unknown function (DUF1780)
MTAEERRYIEQLLMRAEEAHRFFSEPGREWRERGICAMFLRALGVPFAVEDLQWSPAGQDPPDVRFQNACFEVCERLDKGRRRHDEVKADINRYRNAKTLDDVLVDSFHPRPMTYDEIYAHLLAALSKKPSQYGPRDCSKLDAFVYIQLIDRYPLLNSPLPEDSALRQQGWRSVSFVMSMVSHVAYASAAAPTFLQEYVGQIRLQWKDPETFFKL